MDLALATKTAFKRGVIPIIACVVAVSLHGGGAASSAHPRLKGVIAPICLDAETRPALVVRVDAIYPDFERRAFYRIGVLPLAVAEGVTFEFSDSRRFPNLLARAQQRLKTTSAARHVELRQVKFVIGNETEPRLQAGRVRLYRADQWQLLDGVAVQVDGREMRATRAVLHTAGDQAGQVTGLTDRATNTFRLFDLLDPRRISN